MADIKNYGLKGVGNDVQMGKSGGRLKYNTETGVFSFNKLNGSTLENISAAAATVSSLSDGTLTITQGNITNGVNATFTNNVSFGGSLIASAQGRSITGFHKDLDSIGGGQASDDHLITAKAVETFVETRSFILSGDNNDTIPGSVNANYQGNLNVAGTANQIVTSVAGGSVVTIALTDAVTIAGTMTAGNLSTAGNTSTGNLSATGNITGANLISNALVSAVTMTATGNITGGNISTGGLLSFGSLTDGTITVDSFTGNIAASAGNNQIATAETVKAYVDSKVGAATANIAGDSGTGNVDLDSQTLTVSGTANEIETSVSGQTITVGIVSNPTLTGNVSAGTYSATGNITGANLISNALVSAVDVSASSTMTATGNITGGNLSTAGATSTGTLVATGNASAANFNTTGTVATGTLSTTGNATIGGSLLSDDITAATVNVTGDAIITGNLTVQGTTTTVNSTVVTVTDAVFRVNSTGANVSAGIEANTASGVKSFVYDPTIAGWTVGSETLTASTFLGNLTGTAANATVLQNARNFSASGDATASAVSFDGSANVDLALTLANSGVTAGTYGSATQIPQFTVDSKGRVTAASNVSISTYWNLAGDTGSSQIDGGQTANVLGGTNITTSVSGDSVTIDLDNDVTLSGNLSAVNGTFSGALSGGNITTAGTVTATGNITGANLISNALVSAVTMTATGNITGGNISTGGQVTATGNVTAGNLTTTGVTSTGTLTATGNVSAANVVSTGDVSGATGTFSGNVSANNINVTNAITVSGGTGGSITGANSITANYFVANQTVTATGNISGGNISTAGVLSFGSLTDGSITVDSFTGNIFASANANQIATADTVKAYIDAKSTAVTANIAGDSGTGNVDLDSQTLTVSGTAGEIETSVSGQTITVGIVSNPTLTGTVSGGAFTATGNITGANLISNALVSAVTVTASGNVSGAHLNTAGTVTATGNISGGNLTTSGLTSTGTLTTSGNATVGGNLSVTGSLLSDDITSSNVTVTGDAIITGNLTVQGTQTIVNSNVVSVGDAIIRVNSDGTVQNAGLEANVAGSFKQLVWNTANSQWTVNSETFAAGNLTTAGTVSFGSLYDSGANVTVNNFVTSAATIVGNDNDTSVPTTAAVIDYVSAYGGDGLMLRASVSTGSSAVIGTVPNNSLRTYYANKVVLKVTTGYSGGSVAYAQVVENNGTGTVVVAEADADVLAAGTYVIELDGDTTLTRGANVSVLFKTAGGAAATTTAGAMVATVYYNYV